MNGTFMATWIRLRRRTVLGGTFAAAAAVTALSTTLTFVLADTPADQRPGPRGGESATVTTASLSTADGQLQGLSLSVTLFGIIALCLAAATFAGEYGTGTIRTTLLREPRRIRLVIGTWAAVVSFVVAAVLAAAVVAGLAAALLAPGQGISTDSWFTGDGLATSGRTILLVAVAAIGYATLGSALGILLRAAVPAVVLGFGWLFLLETIVASSAPQAGRWLPGQLLAAIATNGTPEITLLSAAVAGLGYLVITCTAALLAFTRRDVTA